jgi:hypothetical protein
MAVTRGGHTASANWHDWGTTGGQNFPMLCGSGPVSESPMPSNTPAISSSQSITATVSPTMTSTSSQSMSATNTPGVCRPYCVGDFGLCQNPLWEDYTCYAHDGAGNCPVNTVSCPNVIEADTVAICQNCAMGTDGPCQHPLDGRCEDHLEAGVCSPGLIFCGSPF